MTTLALSSLAKSFRAGSASCTALVTVFQDVDLTIWPGEMVAVEGAPGSGITTLLRCAAGLLRPDAGAIHWFGSRTVPRDRVAFVGYPLPPRECDASIAGALYLQLENAVARKCRILVVDDLPTASPLERRLMLSLLRQRTAAGASVLLAADHELADSPLVSRAVTLSAGALVQRRKRSAARIASSSPASRARVSARSTYGRNLRSPQ